MTLISKLKDLFPEKEKKKKFLRLKYDINL